MPELGVLVNVGLDVGRPALFIDGGAIDGRVADGGRPEVFAVNLPDIVLHKDDKTNLLLQPGDQIYIGETRRSCLNKCIPPILRPLYETVWTLYRAGQNAVWISARRISRLA